MHLEELFRYIEQNRREFVVKRAAKVSFTGSAAAVFPRGGNKGEKLANDEIEAVLAEVEVGELLDAKD
jgi:hypothetical protein